MGTLFFFSYMGILSAIVGNCSEFHIILKRSTHNRKYKQCQTSKSICLPGPIHMLIVCVTLGKLLSFYGSAFFYCQAGALDVSK